MAIDAATRTARRHVTKLALQHRAAIEENNDGDTYLVTVTAPEGHHWRDGVHELVGSSFVGTLSYAHIWQDIAERMACGVEPCGPACEFWD